MPVHKRKRDGKISWYFKFDNAGSTGDNRDIIRGFGYATKQEAIDAEAMRRIDEQKRAELAKECYREFAGRLDPELKAISPISGPFTSPANGTGDLREALSGMA